LLTDFYYLIGAANMNLQTKLDAFKADFESGKPPFNVNPENVKKMHQATAELKATGLADRALNVGDIAPEFSLVDTKGNTVSSSELLKNGPLIVSFYRGVWCPYCNMELQALEEAYPEFKELGASLVAISPQTPVNSKKSTEQNGVTFPILSDRNSEIGEKFGLKFSLPDYLIEVYKTLGANLPGFNDDTSWTLPMPARYVINQSGEIVYAEINPDYTQRPDPEEMLHAVRFAVGG
jgi:peroxiredoxin